MNEIRKSLEVIKQQKLLCRLDFYEESIFLTKFAEDRKSQYEVSAEDIEQLFSGVEFSTGMLPTNTIFYSRKHNVEKVVICYGATIKKIQLNDRDIIIPIPDHIFIGQGLKYKIFAMDITTSVVYQMPLPNVYKDGTICQGTANFTKCSPESINHNYKTFFDSGFNEDLEQGRVKGDKLIEKLISLDGKRKFPKKWLLEADISLNEITEGR